MRRFFRATPAMDFSPIQSIINEIVKTRFQPGPQAKPGRLAGRKSLRRFSFLAITLALAASLFPPTLVYSQGKAPAQSAADRASLQLLDLKPGCWQYRMLTSTAGMIKQHTVEEIRQEWMAKMTPAQRAQFTPEQWTEYFAQIAEGEKKSEKVQEKGTEITMMLCPLTQSKEREIETSGFGGARCTRTTQASGQALHMHVLCPAANGSPEAEYTSDFESINPENFKGTVRSTPYGAKSVVSTVTSTAKWVSEARTHLPSGATDLNGNKPKGPHDVAALDPFRIVATIDGKQIIAAQAWSWIDRVPPGTRREYDSRLPELVQQLYSQKAIAVEALKLHLERQEPWSHQLQKTSHDTAHAIEGATNYLGDPNIPPGLLAQWDDARSHILWSAYLGQASTEAERQALMQKVKEKYRITVRDPDFFIGH